MQIKELKAYNYEELSEKAREKVRNFFGEHDADIQTDMLKEDFTYILAEKYSYFTDPKFQWSLGCCQGDGLSFSSNFDLNLYLKTKHPKMKESIFNVLTEILTVLPKGNTGHYCYAKKDQVDYEIESLGKNTKRRLESLINNIINEIQEEYMQICNEFEKQGYNQYEYLYSDEYAKETCEANEYTFRENGVMENI